MQIKTIKKSNKNNKNIAIKLQLNGNSNLFQTFYHIQLRI